MNRMIPMLALSAVSLTAFAGRGFAPVAKKRPSAKSARAVTAVVESMERVCALDIESRQFCTGADLADAFEAGIIVVPNPRLPAGTYRDSTCLPNDGLMDREGTYVLADDILYWPGEESEGPWDLPPKYPGCGGDEAAGSGSETYLACMSNCSESYSECITTIHGGGLDPDDLRDICRDARDACQTRCNNVYGG